MLMCLGWPLVIGSAKTNITVRCKPGFWLNIWDSCYQSDQLVRLCPVLKDLFWSPIFNVYENCNSSFLTYDIPSFIPWSLEGRMGWKSSILSRSRSKTNQKVLWGFIYSETNIFITHLFVCQGHNPKTISSIRIYWLAFTWVYSESNILLMEWPKDIHMCQKIIHHVYLINTHMTSWPHPAYKYDH